MSQRYSTDEEILRHADICGPIKVWAPEMRRVQRIADALGKTGFVVCAAFWPDGASCALAFPAAQKRPRPEQVVRAYRAYHSGIELINAAAGSVA